MVFFKVEQKKVSLKKQKNITQDNRKWSKQHERDETRVDLLTTKGLTQHWRFFNNNNLQV